MWCQGRRQGKTVWTAEKNTPVSFNDLSDSCISTAGLFYVVAFPWEMQFAIPSQTFAELTTLTNRKLSGKITAFSQYLDSKTVSCLQQQWEPAQLSSLLIYSTMPKQPVMISSMQNTSSSPPDIHTNLPMCGEHGEAGCNSAAQQDTLGWISVAKDREEMGSSHDEKRQ